MIIRKATKKDILAIVRLSKQLTNYQYQIDKYYKPFLKYKNIDKYIEGLLRDRNTKIVVVEKNGKILGYFTGAIEKAPNYISPKRIGIIHDAFIEKDYRNQGLGKKLFDELMNWFKDNRIKHIELTVDSRNDIGIKAWKEFRFFDYRLKMRRDL